MKHINLFNDFLSDTVNLNQTRIANLEASVEAIKSVVRRSDWEPHLHGWMEQGSWAHKTIIKPVDQGEFDADLIVFVQPVDGWNAEDYIETLYNVFNSSLIYKGMAKRWSHCVTIAYANDKKIDVTPCLVNRNGFTRQEVCNRDTNQFESSEPRQYTNWLIEKNLYSGSNSFRKCTRLLKYLRDIKTRFTCSSVILTTLLGDRINVTDRDSADFLDTPTSLKTLVGRLDDWLQFCPIKPRVSNPFLPSENFSDDWTENQYFNFREKIHTYRQWIDDAFSEQDRSESIAKWRRVFGDEFASNVVLNEGKSVSKVVVANVRSQLAGAAHFSGDLVDAIKRFGAHVLPDNFNKKAHMEAPKWKKAPTNQRLSVSIQVDAHAGKSGTMTSRAIYSLEPLKAGPWLHFKAITSAGLTFDPTYYTVHWRITNTDEAAALANCLRGKIERPETDNSRWEELKYRGVHLVEAFVVNKRTQQIVGQSDVFRVMIE